MNEPEPHSPFNMRSNSHYLIGIALLALLTPLEAQQRVPFRGDTPIAPQGLPILPPPAAPVRFATAEGQDIQVVTLVRGLARPWSLAFVAPDTMLITQRTGQLRVVRGGKLDPQPVAGLPEVLAASLSGLMDLALSPDFATDRYVYFSYNKPIGNDDSALAIGRGRWDGKALTDATDVFVAGTDTGGVSRLAFGGGGPTLPQDTSSHAGKVLRLTPEGKVPADNPFVGKAGYKPEIFTLGHRNTLGLAAHPQTGRIWQLEMGPNGGDELNLLEPGGNYGWPLVSFGRTYPGPRVSSQLQREGFIDPAVFWVPSISTSGLAFYTADRLPKWRGDVFVGGMRYGEIPNTGRLERILFSESMEELRREPLLLELRQRIRDVRQGPDGLLYLLTDYDEGALLRVEPAL